MSGGATNPTEAERWLGIAERLLHARDIVGCKEFAERAIQSDPLLRGVDQILAVAEVHLAAKNNSKTNWYSILQLDPAAADSVAVKRQYRRLALLLHPDNNKSPGADDAFKLVVEAHTVLSDPDKKSLFDTELEIATAHTRSTNTPARSAAPTAGGGVDGAGDSTFWTACPFCFYAYQYGRVYCNRALRCPTCQRAFRAVETAVPPPIVPGTDMYYSAWGFYPLGFPGGPAAPSPADPASGWKPFHPTSPYWGSQPGQPAVAVSQPPTGSGMHANEGNPQGPPQPYGGNVNVVQPQGPTPPAPQQPIRKKKVARKRVGGGEQKTQSQAEPRSAWPGPEAWEESVKKVDNDEVMVVNPDGEVSISGGAKGNAISGMDVDATDELAGNLPDLPFLKEGAVKEEVPKEA